MDVKLHRTYRKDRGDRCSRIFWSVRWWVGLWIKKFRFINWDDNLKWQTNRRKVVRWGWFLDKAQLASKCCGATAIVRDERCFPLGKTAFLYSLRVLSWELNMTEKQKVYDQRHFGYRDICVWFKFLRSWENNGRLGLSKWLRGKID